MSTRDNLKEYLQDLYKGIQSKVPDADRDPQTFKATIESIKTGGTLPTLSNGATPSDVRNDKQFLNENGTVITGQLTDHGNNLEIDIDVINNYSIPLSPGIYGENTKIVPNQNLQDEISKQTGIIDEIDEILNNKIPGGSDSFVPEYEVPILQNTEKLTYIKNKVNDLPDTNNGDDIIASEKTTVNASNVLEGKTYYYTDENGNLHIGSGQMNNWGDSLNVEVDVDGTGEIVTSGYITKVTGSFSDAVYSEISEQSSYIALIGKKLIKKCKLNYYTVEFKKSDGTVLQVNFVKSGESVVYTGKDLTYYDEEGYKFEFIGWDKDTTNVTSDMVVTAKFSSNRPDIITINLTDASQLTVEVRSNNFTKPHKESSIDWGDGTTDTSINTVKSHTYASTGVYNIKTIFTQEDSTVEPPYVNTGKAFVTEINLQRTGKTSVGYLCTGYTNLVKARLPEGITTLVQYQFQSCRLLEDFVIPNSVTTIGASALKDCIKITSLEIPVGVTTIGAKALESVGYGNGNCTFTFKSLTPPTIQANTFASYAIKEIRVPMSALDTYRSAPNWSTYASKIVGY